MSRPTSRILRVTVFCLLLVGQAGAASAARPSFDGVWHTNLGNIDARCRLVQEGNHVRGIYAYAGISTLEGTVEGRTLRYTYNENGITGEGELTLSADGEGFEGYWREDDSGSEGPWTGSRLEALEGLQYIVVIEARWETSMDEREHTWGDILRSYFAAMPGIEVRQRFFNDASDMARICAEVALLPEPAVVCVAAHGSPEGVAANGQFVGPDAMIEGLQYATNVKLMHFSSCQVLRENLADYVQENLTQQTQFPISGYGVSVGWPDSAAIEIVFFHLVLCQGIDPIEAARQVHTMMAFAGDDDLPGVGIKSADFRIVAPGRHGGSHGGYDDETETAPYRPGNSGSNVNPVRG